MEKTVNYLPEKAAYARDACVALGYDYEDLNHGNGYCFRISARGQFFVTGAGPICAYPINNASAFGVSQDKYHTGSILNHAGIASPPSRLLFLTDSHKELRNEGPENDHNIAPEHYPVFAKPNRGSKGDFAEIIYDQDHLSRYCERVVKKYDTVIVQPVLQGREFRVLCLNDSCRFIYQRQSPALIGDGHSLIRELLDRFNNQFQYTGISPVDDVSFLRCHQLTRDYIPEAGERYEITGRTNVFAGGTISHFSEVVPEPIAAISIKATQALNLSISGVDVLEDKAGKLHILEVNGNPSIAGLETVGRRDLAVDLWKEVIETFFNRPQPPTR